MIGIAVFVGIAVPVAIGVALTFALAADLAVDLVALTVAVAVAVAGAIAVVIALVIAIAIAAKHHTHRANLPGSPLWKRGARGDSLLLFVFAPQTTTGKKAKPPLFQAEVRSNR